MSKRTRGVLFVVFTTIFIDFAGFSILIPVLPLYADRLGASNFEVGLILTVYALAQLLFLPAWGWFSDRFGRRPVLLVSLAGTVVAYLMLTVTDSLMGIYVSRILAGFFAAVVGTAQAVVTDVTSPSERARGMGQIGAAMGLALVIGPAFGGILGAFDHRLPFYVVAAVAAVSFLVAWWMLPETRAELDRSPAWSDLARCLVPTPLRLVGAVHDRRIGLYLYLFFHVALAFAVLESVFPKYLADHYEANMLDTGLLFAALGICMVTTQGFVVGHLAGRYRESALVIAGFVTVATGLAVIPAVPRFLGFYAIAPLVALGYGVAYPTFTSLYSQACESDEAGELLGQSQSMATTGRLMSPIWAGLVMDYLAPGLAFVIAGGLLVVAMIVFLVFRRMLVEGG